MNKVKLIEAINDNKPSFNSYFDRVGFTWGVSSVRTVVGYKDIFNNLEHFFLSALLSENNSYSSMAGGQTWLERTNLYDWCNGLNINEEKTETLITFLDRTLIELEEHRKYWQENEVFLEKCSIIPRNINKCWEITETSNIRHFINTTITYLAICEDSYLILDCNWQS